jgi:hypothetical protein
MAKIKQPIENIISPTGFSDLSFIADSKNIIEANK